MTRTEAVKAIRNSTGIESKVNITHSLWYPSKGHDGNRWFVYECSTGKCAHGKTIQTATNRLIEEITEARK